MVVQTPCLPSTAILKLAKAGYDQKGEQCFSAYLIYTRSHFDYLSPFFFCQSLSHSPPSRLYFYSFLPRNEHGIVWDSVAIKQSVVRLDSHRESLY